MLPSLSAGFSPAVFFSAGVRAGASDHDDRGRGQEPVARSSDRFFAWCDAMCFRTSSSVRITSRRCGLSSSITHAARSPMAASVIAAGDGMPGCASPRTAGPAGSRRPGGSRSRGRCRCRRRRARSRVTWSGCVRRGPRRQRDHDAAGPIGRGSAQPFGHAVFDQVPTAVDAGGSPGSRTSCASTGARPWRVPPSRSVLRRTPDLRPCGVRTMAGACGASAQECARPTSTAGRLHGSFTPAA